MVLKLYKVECRNHDLEAYVVAADPTTAYKEFREFLDIYDIGFDHQRELKSVTLLAEASDYPDCKMRLFLCGVFK